MRPVFTTSDALAAELSIEKLVAAGIDAWIQPGGGAFPGTSIDALHVVIVRDGEADAAKAVLGSQAPEIVDAEGGAAEQVDVAPAGAPAAVAVPAADPPGPFTLPPLDSAGLWFVLIVLFLPAFAWSVDDFFSPTGWRPYRIADLAWLAAQIAVVHFVVVRPAGSWLAVGVARPRPLRDLAAAILLLPPVFCWYVLGTPALWGLFGATGSLPPYVAPVGSWPVTVELVCLAVALFGEELVYRGVLQPALAARCGHLSAIGIASALFGLGHMYQGWFGVVGAAGFGIVMGCGFALIQRLWPLWVAHYFWDLYVMGYF